MSEHDRIRENRLRRAADRQGLQLQRCKRRDSRAIDFGTYRLVFRQTGETAAAGRQNGYGLKLDEIEQRLSK